MSSRCLVVMLHGYAMRPTDLSPFAHSLGGTATYSFPEGIVALADGTRAWWEMDLEARAQALRAGPRDLATEYPEGLAAARSHIARLVDEARRQFAPTHVLVGGFSQGGMLACDCVLHGVLGPVAGLFAFSACRIAIDDWQRHANALANLPVFVSHGRTDADLAFAAGEKLRDFAGGAGANVTWLPFDSGHEIPLVVWRQFRKFMLGIEGWT